MLLIICPTLWSVIKATQWLKRTGRSSKSSKNNHQALENSLNKLKNSNIIDKLNLEECADPDVKFNRFMEYFMTLKEQHLPNKVVRFDRTKHKIKAWLVVNSGYAWFRTLVCHATTSNI